MDSVINDELSDSVFEYGCQWLRADFHLHTMQDKQFADKEATYDEYVNGLEKAGIRIGIITNHNKFNWHEYKELKKVARKKRIWILPGVELSVSDGAHGIHVLIVFDPDSWILSDKDFINDFLAAAFQGFHNRENADARCDYSLAELFKQLNSYRLKGRDSFVVLAHVNSGSGFFNELDGGRIKEIAKSGSFYDNVLAMQKVRPTEAQLRMYSDWFENGLPVFVEGSDCKSLEEIGKGPATFVKIGDFSFSSLKLALLERSNRVSDKLPEHNGEYVKTMEIVGGRLNEQRFCFSSSLNCFIGIRGSGKSSILEILRYALDIPLASSSADVSYKNELIEYVLGSGGKVIVHLIGNHGTEYRVEKIYGQKGVLFKEGENEPLQCSLDAVFKTPVYFGQKDLSNKNDDFESDLLRRLAGNRLDRVDNQISDAKNTVISDLLEIQKLGNLENQKRDTQAQIKNALEQLKYYQEKGLEEKMKTQADYESDACLVKTAYNNLIQFASRIKTLLDEYRDEFNQITQGSETNKELLDELNQILKQVNDCINQINVLLSAIEDGGKRIENVRRKLDLKKNNLAEDFAKMKRELNTEDLNPDHFLNLTRMLSTARLKLQQLDKQEEKRVSFQATLDCHLSSLNDVWLQRYHLLENEASTVNTSDSNLNIGLVFKGKRKKMLSHLKETFRGTGIRETTYDALVEKYRDFIEMYHDRKNWDSIISPNLFSAFENRFMENIEDLLTYKVDDDATITYKGKPLNKYSLGQRASALILFLLAQKDTEVLIVDQPEDDLDNQTIYDEVIKSLIQQKSNMQFVFATHNANIPVLGDSEKVFCCSFEKIDRIEVASGSIDTPEIQTNIVKIMEGGKEAFHKRIEIYRIWGDKQ